MLLLPLSFVVGISMIKDIYEDYIRHRSDNEENNRLVEAASGSRFKVVRWRDIQVGQVVKVYENEFFPCDLIILNSSLPKGICYVETKNLDGETNLKQKQACKEIATLAKDERAITKNFKEVTVQCEKENDNIYGFAGFIKFEDRELQVPVDIDQILLRGSSLKNTEWVFGLPVYTGHDTKVMMNSARSRPKSSKLERQMNKYIVISMIIQTTVCFYAACFTVIWQNTSSNEDSYYYLELKASPFSIFEDILINFGAWFLIMMNFVSISLLVSLEMVKFVQGIFIENDWMIFDESKNLKAKVQSSNLNEELGMVKYIFSDKTGTLTQNIMEFKKFSAGKYTYGKSDPKKKDYPAGITNVNFECPTFESHWNNQTQSNPKNPKLAEFINILALCHTIIVDKKDGHIVYNASSPDELALTNAARYFGVVFTERDEDNNLVIENKLTNELIKFQLLNVIEFTSTRKRMTIVVRTSEGRILVITKGADSVIIPMLAPG